MNYELLHIKGNPGGCQESTRTANLTLFAAKANPSSFPWVLLSASDMMIFGLFPPSSRVTLFRLLSAAAFWIRWPTWNHREEVYLVFLREIQGGLPYNTEFLKHWGTLHIFPFSSASFYYWLQASLNSVLNASGMQIPVSPVFTDRVTSKPESLLETLGSRTIATKIEFILSWPLLPKWHRKAS